jgi:hypothetical protein
VALALNTLCGQFGKTKERNVNKRQCLVCCVDTFKSILGYIGV